MAYRDEVLADSPGSYLRLGESSGTNANDEQGFNQDGTYVNSPTLGVAGALVGDADTAITVASASSQRVDWTTLTTLGSSLASSTFECWVKTTSTALGTIMGVVNTGTTLIFSLYANGQGNSTNQDNVAGATLVHVRGNTGSTLQGWVTPANASVNIYDGNWHHVVARFDSTTTVSLFFDGLSQTITYGLQNAIVAANFGFPLMVGARNVRGTADRYLSGSLDEVAIYASRLTDARVRAHYWAGVLKASSAGTSTDTADMRIAQALGATSAGSSTSTAALKVSWALAATSAGTSTTSGALRLALPLAGSSTGSSTTAGDLLVLLGLAGTSAGSSSTTGAATVLWALGGSSAGSSSSSAAARVAWVLEGLSGGTGFTTGDLTVRVPTSAQVALGTRRTASLAVPERSSAIERPATVAAFAQGAPTSAQIVGSTPEQGTTLEQPRRNASLVEAGGRTATITSER